MSLYTPIVYPFISPPIISLRPIPLFNHIFIPLSYPLISCLFYALISPLYFTSLFHLHICPTYYNPLFYRFYLHFLYTLFSPLLIYFLILPPYLSTCLPPVFFPYIILSHPRDAIQSKNIT